MTDIIATLRPTQGIQCEQSILYLFDQNVANSIVETTTRQWLEDNAQQYITEYIQPILDAYEQDKEREIDAYVEEKQSTIFFDNTNLTGTTTAEVLNVTNKAYIPTINNGADISVPTVAGTMALTSDIAITSAQAEINNPVSGQFLQYDGSKWINSNVVVSGYHPDLFDSKWEDYILSDVQWLRADTFSWQDGTTYEVPYNHLVDDIDGKTLQSEIVAGITIQYYLADDKHKICPASEEANVLSLYTTTGVAWYYILDTANQRFKLPRTKYGFTGLRDTVGKYVPESLPNIKGTFVDNSSVIGSNYSAHDTIANGAFYLYYNASATNGKYANPAGTSNYGIGFNANLSNGVYQDSAPVQQRATQMYLYFYIGNFTQTAIENTAGLNASLFNNKADIDLQNINSTGKAYVSNLAMPSDRYVNLTLGASGTTYTAPADGFFAVKTTSSSAVRHNLILKNNTNKLESTVFDNAGWEQGTNIEVKRGDSVNYNYQIESGTFVSNNIYFIYAEGSK